MSSCLSARAIPGVGMKFQRPARRIKCFVVTIFSFEQVTLFAPMPGFVWMQLLRSVKPLFSRFEVAQGAGGTRAQREKVRPGACRSFGRIPPLFEQVPNDERTARIVNSQGEIILRFRTGPVVLISPKVEPSGETRCAQIGGKPSSHDQRLRVAPRWERSECLRLLIGLQAEAPFIEFAQLLNIGWRDCANGFDGWCVVAQLDKFIMSYWHSQSNPRSDENRFWSSVRLSVRPHPCKQGAKLTHSGGIRTVTTS